MTTYYVATTGNNSGTGSAGSPWRTISKAMQANLKPGDDVVVRSGTYKESVMFNKDGSAGNYITLRSEVPGGAKIDVPSGKLFGININANYVEVKGFEIHGSPGGGIIGNHVHHVKVTNNESHNNAGAGIFFGESDFLTIDGNVTYKNASLGVISGISVLHAQNITGDTTTKGFRIIIRNNISHDNLTKNGAHTDGNGIIIDDFRATNTKSPLPGYKYSTLVENNIAYHNGGKGIQVAMSDYVTVRNNTAWHNSLDLLAKGTWRGELSNMNSSHNTWVDNIAVANPKINPYNVGIVNVHGGGYTNKDVDWHGNLTFNGTPGQDSVRVSGGNVISESGNKLGVDPKFVNAPFNFDVKLGSPAINIGANPLSFASVDLDGDAHVGAVDIAAHEAGGGGTSSGVSLYGNFGDNQLYGGPGNDKLYGYAGRDHLSGGDGSDLLRGGIGKDTLVGGADGDVFAFRSTSAAGKGLQRDEIRDFSHSQGDKIDLSGIDANANLSGNQAFSFIDTKAFSGNAGQLQYLNGVIAGDVDGDKAADFQIEITKDHSLGLGDFLL